MVLASLLLRTISSRPGPGRANHNRLSNVGAGLISWLYRGVPCERTAEGNFINDQDGCTYRRDVSHVWLLWLVHPIASRGGFVCGRWKPNALWKPKMSREVLDWWVGLTMSGHISTKHLWDPKDPRGEFEEDILWVSWCVSSFQLGSALYRNDTFVKHLPQLECPVVNHYLFLLTAGESRRRMKSDSNA